MRKAIIIALAAAALPSLAVAAPGGVPGKPATAGHTKAAGKAQLKPIAFVARGSAALDATTDTLELTVKSGNRQVLRAASAMKKGEPCKMSIWPSA